MANICDERVVIVTKTKEYMAEILEKMCSNVLAGPIRDGYFNGEEVAAARGDAEALYDLLLRTEDMNKLCLFSADPDTRSESSWMGWRIDEINGFYIFAVDIGLKWGSSDDPDAFCSQLDDSLCAYSISDGGEAYEWEYMSIDGEWIDADQVQGKVTEAEDGKYKARNMKKLAYLYNLAGVSADLYGDIDW